MPIVLLAGLGLVGYFIYTKYSAAQPVPASGSWGAKTSGGTYFQSFMAQIDQFTVQYATGTMTAQQYQQVLQSTLTAAQNYSAYLTAQDYAILQAKVQASSP